MSGKPKDEWTSVSEEIASELDADALVLAEQLFSEKGPEYAVRPDKEVAQHVLSAYRRGDRTFLNKLALQGPEQFLRVWKSLGGTIPPVDQQQQV